MLELCNQESYVVRILINCRRSQCPVLSYSSIAAFIFEHYCIRNRRVTRTNKKTCLYKIFMGFILGTCKASGSQKQRGGRDRLFNDAILALACVLDYNF